MIDVNAIIRQFYRPGTPIHATLVQHSRQVAALAVRLAMRYNRKHRHDQPIDVEFVEEAAMLHDIGMYWTHAPAIHCHGTQPYICHGIIGAVLLRQMGLPRHARVCERHTGTGLTMDDIQSRQLPLPVRPLLPSTLEEKVICYADKFFSKTHLDEPPRTLQRVRQSLAVFGADTLQRLDELVDLFGLAAVGQTKTHAGAERMD